MRDLIIILMNNVNNKKPDYIKNFDYDKSIIKKDLEEYHIITTNEYYDYYSYDDEKFDHDITIYDLLKTIINYYDETQDIIVYCDLEKFSINKMKTFFEVIKSNFNVSMIQIIEDLEQLDEESQPTEIGKFNSSDINYTLRKQFSKLYDASIFITDKYQCINLTTGFPAIYYNHVSKVKKIMFNILNSYKYLHDADKMNDKSIFEAYNKYYVDLKKIPYNDENGNRNQEYLDYEEKYLCEAMSKHCANQTHHYYDWKNINHSNLLDMIEAIVDIYVSVTEYLEKDKKLNLINFCKTLNLKQVFEFIHEKIIYTILDFFDDDVPKQDFGRMTFGFEYKEYDDIKGLEYIKSKNENFYNILLDRLYYIKKDNCPIVFLCSLNEKGEFINTIDKSVIGTIRMYIRTYDKKMTLVCVFPDKDTAEIDNNDWL